MQHTRKTAGEKVIKMVYRTLKYESLEVLQFRVDVKYVQTSQR